MIQWYPGHMAKAKTEIENSLKLVDIVFELVDARIPFSSRNPNLKEILKKHPKLILMTKSNMADNKTNQQWVEEFAKNNEPALLIDSISGFQIKKIISTAKEVLKEKFAKEKARGLKERPIRAMIVGIPNVGKSTLINTLVNRKVTNVGNKPGVTKAQQWVRINKDLDLLDTPGVLWPKFDHELVALHLAVTGAIKDEVLPIEEVANYLLEYLKKYYPILLKNRYNLIEIENNVDILTFISDARGFSKNKEPDIEKACDALLTDFRNIRIGRITLDRVGIYD